MLNLKRKIYDIFRLYILGPYRGQMIKQNSRVTENLWLIEDFSYLESEPQTNNWSGESQPHISKIGLFSWDYPVMFWIQKLSLNSTGLDVADYGGANGALFDRVKDLVTINSWAIFDLAQLKPILEEKYKNDLRVYFNNNWCDISGYRLLVSYSTLQYILDSSLIDFFNSVDALCEFVIINRVPVSNHKEFICSQFINHSDTTPIKVSAISDYFNIPGWNLLDIWYDDLDKTDRVIFSNEEVTFIGAIYCRS